VGLLPSSPGTYSSHPFPCRVFLSSGLTLFLFYLKHSSLRMRTPPLLFFFRSKCSSFLEYLLVFLYVVHIPPPGLIVASTLSCFPDFHFLNSRERPIVPCPPLSPTEPFFFASDSHSRMFPFGVPFRDEKADQQIISTFLLFCEQ